MFSMERSFYYRIMRFQKHNLSAAHSFSFHASCALKEVPSGTTLAVKQQSINYVFNAVKSMLT